MVEDNPPRVTHEHGNPIVPQSDRPGNKAIASMFDLLGLLFALPFGDDLYHDTPIPWLHWVYLLVGLCCAGFGHMWRSIKSHAPNFVSRTVPAAAQDVRIWILILLGIFAYSVAPDIYRRATEPLSPPTAPVVVHDPPSADDIAKATKPIQDKIADLTRERDDLQKQSAFKGTLKAQLQSVTRELVDEKILINTWSTNLDSERAQVFNGMFPIYVFSSNKAVPPMVTRLYTIREKDDICDALRSLEITLRKSADDLVKRLTNIGNLQRPPGMLIAAGLQVDAKIPKILDEFKVALDDLNNLDRALDNILTIAGGTYDKDLRFVLGIPYNKTNETFFNDLRRALTIGQAEFQFISDIKDKYKDSRLNDLMFLKSSPLVNMLSKISENVAS